jgi:hypothetical protein
MSAIDVVEGRTLMQHAAKHCLPLLARYVDEAVANTAWDAAEAEALLAIRTGTYVDSGRDDSGESGNRVQRAAAAAARRRAGGRPVRVPDAAAAMLPPRLHARRPLSAGQVRAAIHRGLTIQYSLTHRGSDSHDVS